MAAPLPTPQSEARRLEAARLGITTRALRGLLRAKKRGGPGCYTPTPKPAAPEWIGRRITPPLEPDHPSRAKRTRPNPSPRHP